MRKHGWQLPYHSLQIVAIAVFLALGFAFYVFFAPFVGKKLLQYVAMGLYTPLIMCVFSLYIWCAAADPADPGVFKSKKYLNILDEQNNAQPKGPKLAAESTSSICDANAATVEEKPVEKNPMDTDANMEGPITEIEKRETPLPHSSCFISLVSIFPCACLCSNLKKETPDQQISEDGMFYCSLCEVEVFKYSKHCRVCDKCVNRFDHHCRWINNCIGERNYRQFFTLMVSALLMLILQWSAGILVLICCFVKRNRYDADISSKLGSSFSLVPFVIVVALCTILAMIATLPLAQLFFFHILLIKKGISTYDYIVALREQEQLANGGQQSPQMSPASSLTGLSSASSFTTFHRGSWCTPPPRLFLENEFDVVPPDNTSVSSSGKKMAVEGATKKRNPKAVKISPWTLVWLNADEVSKAATKARKKSKILQPIVRREGSFKRETSSSLGNSGCRMVPRPENNRRRPNKRVRSPAGLPFESWTEIYPKPDPESSVFPLITGKSASLVPLQLEARSTFRTSMAMSSSVGIASSSPDSSLGSPELHPFRVSSSGPEEARQLTGLSAAGATIPKGLPLSRSTSDGYEASGGEDSDRVPTRLVERSKNWNNLLFGLDQDASILKFKASSSSSRGNNRKL